MNFPLPTSGVAGYAEDMMDLIRMIETHFAETEIMNVEQQPALEKLFVFAHGTTTTIFLPISYTIHDVERHLIHYIHSGGGRFVKKPRYCC